MLMKQKLSVRTFEHGKAAHVGEIDPWKKKAPLQ